MSAPMFKLSEVQTGIANLVGAERAREIVEKAVHEESLPLRPEYPREDLRRVLQAIRKNGGLVAVVASAMNARLLVA